MRGSHARAVIVLSLLALALTTAAAVASSAIAGTTRPDQAVPGANEIVVRGRIYYIDRDSDRSHPAAGLKVEVYDKDERSFGSSEILTSSVTDANGFFEAGPVTNVDPDGPTGDPEGTQDIFLRLYTDNGNVRVHETGTALPYSWASYQIDERDGLMRNVPDGVVGMPPLYVMESTRNVEALWTFVNLVEGWTFLSEQTKSDPGKVTAFWSPTSSDGPRYDPAARAIFLRDADAGFGDVVLQQEAYALLHNAYGTLPAAWTGCTAGPVEGVKDADDAACAFVQGLATFFALAVPGDPEFESLALRALDLDTVARDAAGWGTGDVVAGRIAGALWDLSEFDKSSETYDVSNSTFADVWAVVDQRQPSTLAEWWQGWIALGKDSCGAIGSLFQNTIDYNTPPVVDAIPELALDEDTTATLDLSSFVTDRECPDEDLAYRLVDAGAADAGVKLLPTGTISVTPSANWFGEAAVRLTVSDGPSSAPIALRVVVRPVNDCPTIQPRVDGQQVMFDQPITLDLLRHGRDVEDTPFDLKWDASMEDEDARVVNVIGRGTTTLRFELATTVVESRNVRVVLTVEDGAGCTASQPVFLSWTARPNRPPIIWWDKLTRSYMALKNTDIQVDLRGVASDPEDRADVLQWRVVNELSYAGWGYEDPDNKQVLRFRPHPDYLGHQLAELQVSDSTGATSPVPPQTAVITLTWVSKEVYDNLPPYILKNRLSGKTVGLGASACYDLLDKAEDPDNPQSSLRWFVVGYDAKDLEVTGQGSRFVCLTPTAQRANFEGCFTNQLIVQDPYSAESDPHEITTCWRQIRLSLPVVQRRSSW